MPIVSYLGEGPERRCRTSPSSTPATKNRRRGSPTHEPAEAAPARVPKVTVSRIGKMTLIISSALETAGEGTIFFSHFTSLKLAPLGVHIVTFWSSRSDESRGAVLFNLLQLFYWPNRTSLQNARQRNALYRISVPPSAQSLAAVAPAGTGGGVGHRSRGSRRRATRCHPLRGFSTRCSTIRSRGPPTAL